MKADSVNVKDGAGAALETLVGALVNPDCKIPHKAVIYTKAGGDVEYSFAEFASLINKAETLLKNLGIKADDPVVFLSSNTPELLAAILATFRLGALAAPVDFRLTQGELVNIARKLKAKVVLSLESLHKDFAALKGELSGSGIALESLNKIESQQESTRDGGNCDYESLAKPAFLILTSGTTGMPKGALHDLASLAANIKELADMAALEPGYKVVLPVPLSHVLGLEVSLAALLKQTTLVMSEMTIEGIIKANNQFKPEFLVGVPTIYGAILTLPEGAIDLQNARVLLCGGAPLPLSLAEEFEKKYQRRLNNGYGSTESKIIAVNLVGPPQSVGKVVPSCQIKILPLTAEDGKPVEPLPEGVEGEIVICGPTLMLGYIGQPEETARVMQDGGYKTGDIGYMKDGYLYVLGRNKEMIIVAGNKVFPAEVEGVLRQCPLVKEVAIIGVAHSKLGQIVKAHIVTTDGDLSQGLEGDEEAKKAAHSKLKEGLREFCQTNLKRELRPMEWVFYSKNSQLPRTNTGKIDKKVLA